MSDHTIVIIWVVKIFLYSSSLYSCHLFLTFTASVKSISFLSFIEPIFAWNVPLGISNFLEEISSLSHSVVFLYFFALISEEGFLSLLAILWNSAFRCWYLSFSLLFFSQLFVRPPQTAILLFCIYFPWGWSWSLSPVQCHEPPFIGDSKSYLIYIVGGIFITLNT